jgi:hypothetical protein
VRAGIDSFRADYLQNKMQGGRGWRDIGYRQFCVLTLNAVRQGLESLRPMGLIAFPFLSHFQHGFFPSISEPVCNIFDLTARDGVSLSGSVCRLTFIELLGRRIAIDSHPV